MKAYLMPSGCRRFVLGPEDQGQEQYMFLASGDVVESTVAIEVAVAPSGNFPARKDVTYAGNLTVRKIPAIPA